MKATHFGFEMQLDEKDNLGLASKRPFEPDLTNYLSVRLGSGDVFIDVGAHIGYYTLLASKKVGWKGHVYAFEPDPTHFATLGGNVSRNRRSRNVTLVEAAVMDFNSNRGPLFLSEENHADHRTSYSLQDREIIQVEYIKLDNYFRDFAEGLPSNPVARSPIDVIKLDIQGSEPYALLGMTEVLNRNPEVTIVTEFWPEGIRQAGWVPEDYLDQLVELDFTLHTMDGELREPEWIMDNIPGGWTGFMNLLCVRE